jgi:hypothetical protein
MLRITRRLGGCYEIRIFSAGKCRAIDFQCGNRICGDCDRTCLMALADKYLAALAAHDPQTVPLSSTIRIVENAKRIRPGEGLWKTASAGPKEFRIVAPNPRSQQVGGMVIMQSEGKPAQVGFRLKLAEGMIMEAEHLIAIPRGEEIPATLKKVRPAIPMEYLMNAPTRADGRFIWPSLITMRWI